MISLKCVFVTNFRNFFGFIVHYRGIEIDLSKIKIIIEMQLSKALKQVCSLLRQTGMHKEIYFQSFK